MNILLNKLEEKKNYGASASKSDPMAELLFCIQCLCILALERQQHQQQQRRQQSTAVDRSLLYTHIYIIHIYVCELCEKNQMENPEEKTKKETNRARRTKNERSKERQGLVLNYYYTNSLYVVHMNT